MLIELWRNAAVQDGFERGRSFKEISNETGLSPAEVLQRKIELHLFSAACDVGAGEPRKEPRALG